MHETSVVHEAGEETPLVVEVPHAGLLLDPEGASYSRVSARSLAFDADLYVDEIFASAPELGATLVCARLTRHIVDLNAAPTPVEDERPGVPRLVTRRSASGDVVTEERPPSRELVRRRRLFHEPYHVALASLIDRKRRRFGHTILVCAHSFPPQTGQATDSVADVVIGTQGGTTASRRYIERVAEAARMHGYRTAHDVPFAGGYCVQRYGRPSDGIHAIQIELARATYLDPVTLARDGTGMARATAFARTAIALLLAP